MSKNTVTQWIEQNSEPLIQIEKDIWNRPELALEEYFASKIQKDYLQSIGFTIHEIPGVETAFYAEYGTGKPVIAILGEYDALPNMSQKVSTVREPVKAKMPGHACGHNLIGTAGVGAVAAIRDRIESGELFGTIRYYGCPAEELYGGKLFMLKTGCFNDLDCSLMWHPQDLNGVTHGQYYSALQEILFRFRGETGQSMAAKIYGGSALQASELMATGVQHMREFIWDYYRIHYAIINDCDRANLIPEVVQVNFKIRSKQVSGLKKLRDRLVEIAQGAALMTKTEVECVLEGAETKVTYNDIENCVLVDLLKKNMQETELFQLTDAEQEFTRTLASTMRPGAQEKTQSYYAVPNEDICANMHTGIFDKDDLFYLPSDDAGNVSWIAPFGSFLVSMVPVGMPMHCWQATALSGSSIGEKTMIYAAKVLAGTVYDLMNNPTLVAQARTEFEKNVGEVGTVK